MNNFWLIIQSIIAILIVVAILMQSQGGGLGTWGGGGGETYHTKRGVEKVIFNATIILIALFALISIAALITT